MIDPVLLELLACPACRAAIRPAGEAQLACTRCGRHYPVRDGIPVLLLEEAAGGPTIHRPPSTIVGPDRT